jgi:outer membrane protein insertion porin family
VGYKTSRKIDWASHEQILRGASLKLRTLNQEFGIEQVLRTINVDRENASPSVRAAAGNEIKSSLSHGWTYDTRDLAGMPSKGHYLKINQELSGAFGLGRKFFKVLLESQHAITPAFTKDNLSLVASFRGGFLWMLENRPSHLADRFYLGGPNDIRGFYQNALGPRDSGDSVGGDCVFGASISALSRLPHVPKHINLRAQWFLAGGSVLPLDRSNLAGSIKSLVAEPSIATGIGLAYLHQVARFELNLTMPLVSHRLEGTRKGLQFGIGISFM